MRKGRDWKSSRHLIRFRSMRSWKVWVSNITLFAAYKTIKTMEKQGKNREEICAALKEKFGEKNPDVKVM